MAERVIIERLYQHVDPFYLLGWDRPPSVDDVKAYTQADFVPLHDRPYPKPSEYDYGRIAYFLERFSNRDEVVPIEIDNFCNSGNIYDVPIILDGCHRLAAAILSNQKHITATYGGRVDLLE